MSPGSTSNMLRVSIESQEFPGSYLRIDGSGVVKPLDYGGGLVNCQNAVGAYETLIIVNHPDDNTFSILSAFSNVYLRMDGTSVSSGGSYPDGAGQVNCQYGDGAWEKFRFKNQADGSKAIVSVQFPNIYLRMENSSGGGGGSGSGTVNCQNAVGAYEKFKIHVV